ncbi:MAG: phosphate acyltransferase PlsX [Chloroflexi bacterium]|nr:phosphate acyltransferase PlsX [Chloroflexota bacterium]MCI0575558.1 phosphate acyltransferase PlsX [Chloroflexota bacterium]MCI0649964.1 phosphate acyltransferase PlsX [Chloroflexota bacterium]MCI0729294.1 phosphate acyltransferase PlsX [Chloroflexota bacterium]
MRIVVDAMGSDAHPAPDVAGAVMAAREFGDEIILVGDQPRVEAELAKHDTTGLPLRIQHASQVIEMTDKPGEASRTKKDSSMHVGLRLVKEGEADAFVSAGNTGGVLAVATLHTLRRIRGVLRPALGVIFPIKERPMLIDNGANADCKPEYLLQFGLMGSLYVERILGLSNPRVALLSNGEEEGKGNELIKETIPLLASSGLNYVGNIEPKEFMRGHADVGVTDGFTGNLVIKTAESVASYMSDQIREELMSNPLTILGGLLSRPAFKRIRRQLDPDEVGGAPLLGVNGVVVIAHGRSNTYAVKQAVRQARRMVEMKVVEAIATGLEKAPTQVVAGEE